MFPPVSAAGQPGAIRVVAHQARRYSQRLRGLRRVAVTLGQHPRQLPHPFRLVGLRGGRPHGVRGFGRRQ